MKTITLRYNATDVFAKKILEELLASGAFSMESKQKKTELQKSIEEARNGKYFVAKDAKDAIAQCLA